MATLGVAPATDFNEHDELYPQVDWLDENVAARHRIQQHAVRLFLSAANTIGESRFCDCLRQ